MAATRRLYLVILTALVVALAVTGVYLRQRAVKAAAVTPAAEKAADCATPAPPPPPPATPPPKLPGFTVEAGCATGAAAAKPAPPKAPR